jgi:hypothetical protein
MDKQYPLQRGRQDRGQPPVDSSRKLSFRASRFAAALYAFGTEPR